jgi:hypothetical protein
MTRVELAYAILIAVGAFGTVALIRWRMRKRAYQKWVYSGDRSKPPKR